MCSLLCRSIGITPFGKELEQGGLRPQALQPHATGATLGKVAISRTYVWLSAQWAALAACSSMQETLAQRNDNILQQSAAARQLKVALCCIVGYCPGTIF